MPIAFTEAEQKRWEQLRVDALAAHRLVRDIDAERNALAAALLSRSIEAGAWKVEGERYGLKLVPKDHATRETLSETILITCGYGDSGHFDVSVGYVHFHGSIHHEDMYLHLSGPPDDLDELRQRFNLDSQIDMTAILVEEIEDELEWKLRDLEHAREVVETLQKQKAALLDGLSTA
jgi:hypothetical protein